MWDSKLSKLSVWPSMLPDPHSHKPQNVITTNIWNNNVISLHLHIDANTRLFLTCVLTLSQREWSTAKLSKIDDIEF